ncbi:MAG TPA: hypothetical protein PLN85_01600 [archaeon]|nr:hypothetical protein [archaeon]HRS53252.1 hypothetical protein [Bacteroidales bacterium]
MQIRLFKNNNELILNRNFNITNFNYETRNKIEAAALQDGGKQIGLDFFESVEFNIEGSFKNKGVNTDLQISEFLSWLKENAGFSIQIIGSNKYLDNCFLKNSEVETFVRGDYVKIKVKIISESVFWCEDVVIIYNNINDNDIIEINNEGHYLTYPIFIITSETNISQIKLDNTTINKIFSFTYFLNNNETIEFNSEDNKAILNNNINVIEYTNGNFIYFKKGLNNIKYYGGLCDIIIKYKKRYTF